VPVLGDAVSGNAGLEVVVGEEADEAIAADVDPTRKGLGWGGAEDEESGCEPEV